LAIKSVDHSHADFQVCRQLQPGGVGLENRHFGLWLRLLGFPKTPDQDDAGGKKMRDSIAKAAG
jgi:hypothetical protein